MRITGVVPDAAQSKPAEPLPLRDLATPFKRNAVPLDGGKVNGMQNIPTVHDIRSHLANVIDAPVVRLPGMSGAEYRREGVSLTRLRAMASALLDDANPKTTVHFTAADPKGMPCTWKTIEGKNGRIAEIRDIHRQEEPVMLRMYKDPDGGAPHVEWMDTKTGKPIPGRHLHGDDLDHAEALVEDAYRAAFEKPSK